MTRRKSKVQGKARREAESRRPSQSRRFRWPAVVVAFAIVMVLLGVLARSRRSGDERPVTQNKLPGTTSPPRQEHTESASTIQLPDHHAVLTIDDPVSDGWDSEVFHQLAKQQLDKLGQLLVAPDSVDPASLDALISADFSCGPLAPETLVPVFEDAALLVERAAQSDREAGDEATAQLNAARVHRGAEGLADAVRFVSRPLSGARDTRFKFKIVRVEPGDQSVTTRQYVAVSGRRADGMVEQHARWDTQWTQGSRGDVPKLMAIVVHDFEQTTTSTGGATLLVDCTEAALQQNDCYPEQLLRGLNHWLARMPNRTQSNLVGLTGIAAGDANGDGLEDIYLCQDPGIPNRLFLQQSDGTLRDASAEWQVDWLQDSRGALLVDLDNDGDQDLAVAILGGVVLAANEANERFEIRDVVPTGEDTTTLTAVDYDQDGRLDLHVCVYGQDSSAAKSLAAPVTIVGARHVFHDSQQGGANLILRNEIAADGEWRFTDVTAEIGLDAENRRWSYAASWEDFDNDGDQDLYVANDFGPNHLFRNDQTDDGRRKFVNVAEQSGSEDRAFGMSAHWGDYDRDGNVDLYVGNMFSAAGNRVTHQQRFKPGITPVELERFRYLTKGNTLLHNRGDGTFEDVSDALAVTLGRWAWNSRFVDLNNDGWQDLVVANGFVTNAETSDL
jgi:hypothetical protein